MKTLLLLLGIMLPLVVSAQSPNPGRPFRVLEWDKGFSLALVHLEKRKIQIPESLQGGDRSACRETVAALRETFSRNEVPEANVEANEVTLVAYVEMAEARAKRPGIPRAFRAADFQPLTELSALVTVTSEPLSAEVEFDDSGTKKPTTTQKFCRVRKQVKIMVAIPGNAEERFVTPLDSRPRTEHFKLR